MDAIAGNDGEALSMEACLASAEFIDSDSPEVRSFTLDATRGAETPREKAVALYYAVRDKIRYDPYVAISEPDSYRASSCIKKGRGFCIGKAALLAACARAVGIPARVAYADVRNHLSTPRLKELMGGSDVFLNHGFTELYLDGAWIKVTPTFNLELCEKFGVVALDFDGEADALLHPYDQQGRLHMEYMAYNGSYADVPAQMLSDAMIENYGAEVCENLRKAGGDFGAEAAQEAG